MFEKEMNQVEVVILTFDNSKLVTGSFLLFCFGKINMEADLMNGAAKLMLDFQKLRSC